MRTCSVSQSEAAAVAPSTITKDAKVDILKRSDGDAFNDRRADGGQEEENEGDEQRDGERCRRSQHAAVDQGLNERVVTMSAECALSRSGESGRIPGVTLVIDSGRRELVTAI